MRAAIADPVPNLSTITSTVYQQCIEQEDLSVIINISWGTIASFIHEVLLPYSIPVVSFSLPVSYHRLSVDTIIDVLKEKHISRKNFEQEYLFTMAPNSEMVLKVLNVIADHYGWRKVGLIVEDHGLIRSNRFIKFQSRLKRTRYQCSDKYCYWVCLVYKAPMFIVSYENFCC